MCSGSVTTWQAVNELEHKYVMRIKLEVVRKLVLCTLPGCAAGAAVYFMV
jgi:hypothetical protein